MLPGNEHFIAEDETRSKKALRKQNNGKKKGTDGPTLFTNQCVALVTLQTFETTHFFHCLQRQGHKRMIEG